MDGGAGGPDLAASERVFAPGLGVRERESRVWGRVAQGRGGREEAEGFFEDGRRVGEGVEEVRGRLQRRR